MKRIAQSALVLAIAACSTETIYIHDPNPNPVDDAGVPIDDAGNPVADSAPPANATLAKNLNVTDIAVFQGVKVMVVKGGSSAARNAPIVANRDALIRVYATPGSGWSAHQVTAYLTLQSGSSGNTTLKDIKTISGPWDETDSTSMYEFKVPAASMQTDTQFSVQLIDLTATGTKPATSPAQFPNDGSVAPLGVRSSGATLKVYYFPVVTNGITPSTDSGHMQQVKDTLLELYPVASVTLTAQSPINYPYSPPQANGSGWGQMLQWFLQKRQSDAPGSDVYYYGAFTPTSSFGGFCGGGCVAGLSSLAQSPQDAWARGSIGLGYSGGQGSTMETAFTAAHEIGHAHGRNHANCGGAQGVDPQFPYSNGGVGVWGYSIVDHSFIDPTKGHDMMGYCQQSEWISDYTFTALFNRLAAVNGASMYIPPEQNLPRQFKIVQVDELGALTWGDTITARTPVYGDERTIKYLGSDNQTIETRKGYYYAYDHLPGGYMLVPLAPTNATQLQVLNAGLDAATLLTK